MRSPRPSLRQARQAGQELADYADFLGARASHEAGDEAAAEAIAARVYGSLSGQHLRRGCRAELEANVLLAHDNAARRAERVLAQAKGLAAEDRTGFQLAEGQAEYALGERDAAGRHIQGNCC